MKGLRDVFQVVLRVILWLSGCLLAVNTALEAYGGRAKLWEYTTQEEHRFTAAALLTGTLRLRNGVLGVRGDEQIFNGAVYTDWGYGVPLLQLPFHAYARATHVLKHGFFPERAIFFFYLALLIPVLCVAFHRLIVQRRPDLPWLRRDVLAWSATVAALTFSLYPLISCRFIVYEETIAYFVVLQLFALAAYIFTFRSSSLVPVVALAVAAGFGLLIRPTGLFYLGVWAALLLLERRNRKSVIAFAATAAPFVGFWFRTNLVRSGSIMGVGFNNAMPFFPYHTGMQRFGSRCSNTVDHAAQVASRLFDGLFLNVSGEPSAYMKKCHLDFELRNGVEQPFLGTAVLVLLVLILAYNVSRRSKRLADYIPFAAIFVLFASYVYAGSLFCWRYAGDFWPLVVLICVHAIRTSEATVARRMGLALAFVLVVCAWGSFVRDIKPSLKTIEVLDAYGASNLDVNFASARWGTEAPLEPRLSCGQAHEPPYHNGQGWGRDCSVDTFTNVFLGVPNKADTNYELRFQASGTTGRTLRVYVNGRYYDAERNGDYYTAPVQISYAKLTVPTVMVAVEWTRELDAPNVKLMSIELA